jgi:YgiT-type zinc finger domain-containing protein
MDRPQDAKKELIPDTCICGRGKLHRGYKEYVTKVNGGGVLVIKNVPALMCDICDEAYLTPEASREIDKIVKDFREGKLLAKPIAAGEVDLKMKEVA